MDTGEDNENVIHVGGVSTTGPDVVSVTTRAENEPTPAETLDWLKGPLFSGLDITYRKGDQSRIAVLKLLPGSHDGYDVSEGNIAKYSFYDRHAETGAITTTPAKWFDNGAHIFEGLYVPENIQYHLNQGDDIDDEELSIVESDAGRAPLLTTDQHGTNYNYLEHYLGMPANYSINATVGRIVLPFRHRLARVIAYILIDPSMGSDVKIEGYNSPTDDPTSTSIKFSNVWVLSGVKDSYDTGKQHHTFTPQWYKARKVIPHFLGERGSYTTPTTQSADNFIMYYKDLEDPNTYVYPADANWPTIHAAVNNNGYKPLDYGKVPCYDLIVRPTYKNENNIMYDEEDGNKTASLKNNITFDITLNNKLVYQKDFEFDLNANQQTIVYLRITREQVDYNSSGSEVWDANYGNDGYFGVNNENGNTLSLAGSSWQRAYSNVKDGKDYPITDGSKYPEDDDPDHIKGEDGQYLTENKWIKNFFEANIEGAHHGDYFILENDITIAASVIPDNFVFTGHLDGRGHKITVTGGGEHAVTTNYNSSFPIYYKKKGASDYTEFVIGTGDGQTPLYVSNEVAHARPQTRADGPASIEPGEDQLIKADPQPASLAVAMENGANYFIKNEDGTYTALKDVVFYRVAPSFLFAGLDGEYTTAQESDATQPWEANVHKEVRNSKTYWVPLQGYRAEVLNTTVSGCRLFKSEAAFKGSSSSGGPYDVTGYVYRSSGSEGPVSNDPNKLKY